MYAFIFSLCFSYLQQASIIDLIVFDINWERCVQSEIKYATAIICSRTKRWIASMKIEYIIFIRLFFGFARFAMILCIYEEARKYSLNLKSKLHAIVQFNRLVNSSKWWWYDFFCCCSDEQQQKYDNLFIICEWICECTTHSKKQIFLGSFWTDFDDRVKGMEQWFVDFTIASS